MSFFHQGAPGWSYLLADDLALAFALFAGFLAALPATFFFDAAFFALFFFILPLPPRTQVQARRRRAGKRLRRRSACHRSARGVALWEISWGKTQRADSRTPQPAQHRPSGHQRPLRQGPLR